MPALTHRAAAGMPGAVSYILAVMIVCVWAQALICLPVFRNVTVDWWKLIDWWRLFFVLGLMSSMLCGWKLRKSHRWHFWLALAVACLCAQFLQNDGRIFLWIALALLGALPLVSLGWRIVGELDKPRTIFSGLPDRRYRVFYATVALLVLAGFGIGLWVWSCFFAANQSVFFSLRAVGLGFGVSPLLPAICAAAALALFAVVQITRLFMANYQQPEVITKDVHKTLQWQLEKLTTASETPCCPLWASGS